MPLTTITTAATATAITTRTLRPAPPTPDDIAATTAPFLAVRPRLVGIAHRILGSRAEAEDVVQDAWLRWQGCDRAAVDSPTAFLVTATTRLALNAAASARVRRAADVGDTSPDPADTSADPSLGAERREALEHGLLLLLERLGPAERAAYVLRHAFGYPHRRIAAVLRISEANARQIVSRAGRHLRTGRRRPVGSDELGRVVHAFVMAARGEVAALEDVLTRDVLGTASGGGLRQAA